MSAAQMPETAPTSPTPQGGVRLAARLEAFMAEHDLKEGERLPPERRLSAELGVSRASLREAIQQLAARGVLRSRQGGGTFVARRPVSGGLADALAPLGEPAREDPGYWQDVMEIRRSLEGDAAYFAALRAGPADKARLAEKLSQLRVEGGGEADAQADAAFHMAVAEAAQNAVLRQVMQGLFHLMRQSISESLAALYRLPTTAEALDRQHRAILAAIEAGDGPAARKAALDHLDFVERSLRPLQEDAARARRAEKARAARSSKGLEP